jgi:hypothetical protein
MTDESAELRGDEYLHSALRDYAAHTAAALDIDSYARQVYEANRAAGY